MGTTNWELLAMVAAAMFVAGFFFALWVVDALHRGQPNLMPPDSNLQQKLKEADDADNAFNSAQLTFDASSLGQSGGPNSAAPSKARE